MDPNVSLPREALAELLLKADSPLTPEEYLASLAYLRPSMPPPALGPSRSFRRRAVAAAINKYSILVVAVAGIFLLPVAIIMSRFSLDSIVENTLIVAGLWTVVYFEYRVHRYFREGNPRAPMLGFNNQGCFVAGILLYCGYHMFYAGSETVKDMTMVEYNNLLPPDLIKGITKLVYAIVAIIAGGSQLCLAVYYRLARP